MHGVEYQVPSAVWAEHHEGATTKVALTLTLSPNPDTCSISIIIYFNRTCLPRAALSPPSSCLLMQGSELAMSSMVAAGGDVVRSAVHMARAGTGSAQNEDEWQAAIEAAVGMVPV